MNFRNRVSCIIMDSSMVSQFPGFLCASNLNKDGCMGSDEDVLQFFVISTVSQLKILNQSPLDVKKFFLNPVIYTEMLGWTSELYYQ